MKERATFNPDLQQRMSRMPLSGDSIIPDHEKIVAYDSAVEINGSVDEVWQLVSRWGLREDGTAGLLLPPAIEKWFPKRYRSLSAEQALRLNPLKAEDTATDGPKGHKAIVREHTDEGPGAPKTLLFESHWPTNGRHYTYQFFATKGQEGKTLLLARTRWEGAKRPTLVQKLAPVVDEKFMQLFKAGLEERLNPLQDSGNESAASANRKVVAAATIGGALLGREVVRPAPNKLVKVVAPLVGAVAGYAAARKIAGRATGDNS